MLHRLEKRINQSGIDSTQKKDKKDAPQCKLVSEQTRYLNGNEQNNEYNGNANFKQNITFIYACLNAKCYTISPTINMNGR